MYVRLRSNTSVTVKILGYVAAPNENPKIPAKTAILAIVMYESGDIDTVHIDDLLGAKDFRILEP
jgi:N12 class adenine-specific DNA methylase